MIWRQLSIQNSFFNNKKLDISMLWLQICKYFWLGFIIIHSSYVVFVVSFFGALIRKYIAVFNTSPTRITESVDYAIIILACLEVFYSISLLNNSSKYFMIFHIEEQCYIARDTEQKVLDIDIEIHSIFHRIHHLFSDFRVLIFHSRWFSTAALYILNVSGDSNFSWIK